METGTVKQALMVDSLLAISGNLNEGLKFNVEAPVAMNLENNEIKPYFKS